MKTKALKTVLFFIAITSLAFLLFVFLPSEHEIKQKLGGGTGTIEELENNDVRVSSNDTTAGFLNGKLVAGSNITLTENNNGANETLTIASTGGGGGTPGGSDTQVQYNDGGAFGGDAGLTYNETTDALTAGSLTLTTDLTVANGGTGASTLTGLLQGNGTSAFTAIANSSTVGQVLRVTGASTYGWGALDLDDADAITGSLGEANGGTNQTTYTKGDILYASAANTLSKLAIGTSNQLLATDATGVPKWVNVSFPLMNISLLDSVAASTTTYYNFDGFTSDSTTEANRQSLLPVTCTAFNFYVRTTSTQNAGGSLVFTVRGGAGDTSITLTVAAGSAAGVFSDTSNTHNYTAGDRNSVKVVNNYAGGVSATIGSISLACKPTV